MGRNSCGGFYVNSSLFRPGSHPSPVPLFSQALYILRSLPCVYAHSAEQVGTHVGKDAVFDTSCAARIGVQERFDLLTREAGFDEEIEELQKPKLAFMRLVNVEQTLAISTDPREPARSLLAVAAFHICHPTDLPVSGQPLRRTGKLVRKGKERSADIVLGSPVLQFPGSLIPAKTEPKSHRRDVL